MTKQLPTAPFSQTLSTQIALLSGASRNQPLPPWPATTRYVNSKPNFRPAGQAGQAHPRSVPTRMLVLVDRCSPIPIVSLFNFKLSAHLLFRANFFSLPLVSTPDITESGGRHLQDGSPLSCEPTFPGPISARS